MGFDFLNLEVALLFWILVGIFIHELGHVIITRLLNYKVIAIFSVPFPGVIVEIPKSQLHSDLILIGGCFFNIISILLFLPFVNSKEKIVFLIVALVIGIFLSISDFLMIIATRRYKIYDVWIQSIENLVDLHNKVSKYGLSNIIILEEKKFKEILDFNKDSDKISIVSLKSPGLVKKSLMFFSLIALISTLAISFINWPVFWILSNVFKLEVEADFSLVFLVMLLINIILIIIRYVLFWRENLKE